MIIEDLRDIARAADMPFGYGNSTRMREFFADGGGIFCLYVPFGGIPGQETWQAFVRGVGAAAAVKMVEERFRRGGSLNITRTADGYRVDISRSIRVPFSSGGPRVEPVVTGSYLYLEAVDAGAVVSAGYWGDDANSPDMNYSTDGGSTWTAWNKTYDSGEEIYIYDNITLGAVGDKVWFKGVNNAVTDNNTYGFLFNLKNGNVAAGGSATSILDGDGMTMTEMTAFGLCALFGGCTALTTAPSLPATTLANNCYDEMFGGCTALTTAPELPATTLADYCYRKMFSGCTALTTVPQLPATTLANDCYDEMFGGCTALTTAPELPATTLADYCYRRMFSGCTALTTAPSLPATTLADDCYEEMFYGCTALTTAPSLPATTLADYCYEKMFYGCTALTTAPSLPATTLADYCYENMFYDCTALTSITCLATDISATDCTAGWLMNVAANGTFTKAASMSDWTTGTRGIPIGWTVQDYNG